MAKKNTKQKKVRSQTTKTETQTEPYRSYDTSDWNSPLQKLYEKDLIYYHLFASDFPKMKDFYQNVLEFPIAGEAPPEYGWCDLYLPVPGARIGLFKTDKKLANDNAAPSLNVPVKDLEQSHKMLKEKNVDVSEIIDVPTQISMFDFRDPEGNRISFVGSPRIK